MNRGYIAVVKADKDEYKFNPPFNPPENYPEYPFSGIDQDNAVYKAFRDILIMLELDKKHFDTKQWNPLGEFISPGDKVVIKPNFVRERNLMGADVFSIITHPSVIRAIVDYVFIALEKKGTIVIADAPQCDCDFEKLLRVTKLESIQQLYTQIYDYKIEIRDLRKFMFIYNRYGILEHDSRISLQGDPEGYSVIDLGKKSALNSFDRYANIVGADYDRRETIRHHHMNKHEYFISNTILSADVLISVPKLKVHKKAGVTLNLKNMVGINGDKNYLPHYRLGPPSRGGDELPDTASLKLRTKLKIQKFLLYHFLTKNNIFLENLVNLCLRLSSITGESYADSIRNELRAGEWYGNDTIWRTIIDLNRIIHGGADKQTGKKFFSVIDGIVGGEKEGPIESTPKACGILIAGFDPVWVDVVATELMGFNHVKIPQYNHALYSKNYQLTQLKKQDIKIKANVKDFENVLSCDHYRGLGFEPSSGWRRFLC